VRWTTSTREAENANRTRTRLDSPFFVRAPVRPGPLRGSMSTAEYPPPRRSSVASLCAPACSRSASASTLTRRAH
jgi:hypothetical protein